MPTTRTASEFVRACRYGVLATQSCSVPGFPFGSVTPYVLTAAGNLAIYISTLAEHTRNIAADPKVSLTVFDPADATDPQSGPRLTWLGEAYSLVGADADAVAERYFRFFPAAEAFAGSHDFSFYALGLRRLRYIGGFGKIGWIEPHEIDLSNPLASAEHELVEHMNGDHSHAVLTYCRHFFGLTPQRAFMVGADADGIDLLADGRPLRLPFPDRAETPQAARAQLITLLQTARQNSVRAPT